MRSIILNHCWVCPSKDGLNDHHVVPQAYGGEHGPQVTLCATHHTFIHSIALRPLAERGPAVVEHTSNPDQQAKLSQLIDLIAKARAATKGMEKPMMVQHKFNKERSRKLKELKHLLGCSSIHATLERCVDTIYDQCTQLKKSQ